jgi:hypothetical protein
MRRHNRTVLAGAASALIACAGASPATALTASTSTADQARLDAAIDAFEQRMTDAGWMGEPAEEGEDDAEGEDDSAMGDDEFNACLGELAFIFENVDDDEFPGQTGMRESLEFTYLPEGAVPETTEEFSFELEAEETAASIAVSVEDSSIELLDSFVDAIGAKETGDCMREAMEAEMAADATDEEMPISDFSFEVENEADLGIGDRSARLTFGLAAELMGIEFALDMDMYLVRVGRDLVIVIHGTFGEVVTMSGFDPLAELQTIVDSL